MVLSGERSEIRALRFAGDAAHFGSYHRGRFDLGQFLSGKD
jgi:hypothetical protein